MKQVINKKVYNTETAECLAEYDNGLSGGDFHSLSESLYKTKKGAYFMHGVGGPMTEYAVRNGNNTSGSSKITPMIREEAIEWAESRKQTHLFDTEFADAITEA
jgi:hypothetical protein